MKIPVVEQILKDDLARSGETLPGWIDQFLYVINNFIQTVGQALQGNLDFANNFYGAEISYKLVHSVAQVYTPPVGKQIKGITLIDTGGQVVTGFGFTRLNSGSASITALFQAAGKTASTCLMQVQFK